MAHGAPLLGLPVLPHGDAVHPTYVARVDEPVPAIHGAAGVRGAGDRGDAAAAADDREPAAARVQGVPGVGDRELADRRRVQDVVLLRQRRQGGPDCVQDVRRVPDGVRYGLGRAVVGLWRRRGGHAGGEGAGQGAGREWVWNWGKGASSGGEGYAA